MNVQLNEIWYSTVFNDSDLYIVQITEIDTYNSCHLCKIIYPTIRYVGIYEVDSTMLKYRISDNSTLFTEENFPEYFI